MNKTETLKMLAILECAYPAFYSKSTTNEKEMIAKLWNYQFSEIPAEMVNAGLMSIISTKADGFPPTIGEIKAEIIKLFSKDNLTPLEAWEKVRKAMRKCGYENTRKTWETLPESVRDVISPSGLERMAFDNDFNNSVEFSNFQKSYLESRKNRNDFRLLPAKIKQLINEAKLLN